MRVDKNERTHVLVIDMQLEYRKISLYLISKIEKVPRSIRGEKSSKDMASSRNLVSTIGAQASPKGGRIQVIFDSG